MQYVSTRGGAPRAAFLDILLGGLMDDGGLAMPERYPQVGAAELAAWRGLSSIEIEDWGDAAADLRRVF
jgi:threonine synthase